MGVNSAGTLVLIVAVFFGSIESSGHSRENAQERAGGQPSRAEQYPPLRQPPDIAGVPVPSLQRVKYPSDPPPGLCVLMGKGESTIHELNTDDTLFKTGNLIVGWFYTNPQNEDKVGELYNPRTNKVVAYSAPAGTEVPLNDAYKFVLGVGGPAPDHTQLVQVERKFWYPKEAHS